MAVTSAFLLPTPRQMSPSGDVHVTLAGHHAPFVILAILEAEALEFVPRGICVANRQSIILGGYGRSGWDRWRVGSFDMSGVGIGCGGG